MVETSYMRRIHFREQLRSHQPSRGTVALLAAGTLLIPAIVWAIRDYGAWRRLGPGGVEPNLRGWLKVTRWRTMQAHPLDVSGLREIARPDCAYLAGLRGRDLPRPQVAPHPVPHRQLDGRADPATQALLQRVFDETVASHSGITYQLSQFERHTPAVTCSVTCSNPSHSDPGRALSRGEIAHIHALDGSMHMILSPADTITAIEQGWGELHGLAGKAAGLPPNYMIVYAPQSTADVAVIGDLLRAAVAYATAASATAATAMGA